MPSKTEGIVCYSAEARLAALGRRDKAHGHAGRAIGEFGESLVGLFFLVEDEVGEFFFPAHEDQAILVDRGTVVGLRLADADESALDIVVGDVVFHAEVAVIEAQLAEAHAPDGGCVFIVFDMRLVANVFFIYTAELDFS